MRLIEFTSKNLYRFFKCGVVLFLGSPLLGELIFYTGDEDATVINDWIPHLGWGPGAGSPAEMAVGDFNGNGIDDVAVILRYFSENGYLGLFLDPLPGETLMSREYDMRVLLPETLEQTPLLAMADLNNDDKQDLIIAPKKKVPPWDGSIDILFGRVDPKTYVDLVNELPDLRIIGKANSRLGSFVAPGDFNGDGADDLLVGAPGINECYILEGSAQIPLGIIHLTNGVPFPRLLKTGIGESGVRADLNRDGKDDMVLNLVNDESADVVFGRDSFPAQWTVEPTVHINNVGLGALGAGDMTGEGIDDLFFLKNVTNIAGSSHVFVVDGADILSGGPLLDLSTTSVNAVAGYPVYNPLASVPLLVFADFDGDGAKDLVLKIFTTVVGFLTTEIPLSDRLRHINTPSFTMLGSLNDVETGAFNGDGKEDLAVLDTNYPVIHQPYFGSVRILYGFKPFRDPTLRIRERSPAGSRVTLELFVAGDPVEMMFSGSLTEDFLNRWVPYAPIAKVDLTPEAGNKAVTVVFRNSVGRVSDPVSDTVTLKAEFGEQTAVTTVLDPEPGSVVRVDCRLDRAGHITAAVYRRDGRLLARLMDEDRGPGVWPVDWDGRTTEGVWVPQDVYVLIITLDGQTKKHKIVVR